jgi:hypothetical protein
MARRAGRRSKYRTLWALALALLLCAGGALFFRWQQTGIQTEEIVVTDARLPAAFDGLRVVLVSDVHSARFGQDNEALLAAVEALEPDLIAITGDLVDSYRPDLTMVAPLGAGLAAIAPTYYVTGNHEWALGTAAVEALKDTLTDCGVTVLSNQYLTLERAGEILVLAGMDDPNGYADQKTLETLMEEIRGALGDPFVLLLAHRNNAWPRYARCGVDLTLCGHGHGGLVRLPFTDGVFSTDHQTLFPSYTSGLYENNGSVLFVTRGLGNTGSTFRLFNRPEVAVVTMHCSFN